MSDEAPSTSGGSEPLTGRQADNAAGGFKEMPANTAPERKEKEITTREAAAELAASRGETTSEPDPVFYSNGKGGRAPANEAISLERAQQDRAAWIKAQSDNAEVESMLQFDNAVSQHHQDEGLDPATAQVPEPNTPQLDSEPTVDGLHPEVAKAIKLPQVRQHLEAEQAKVAQAESQYAAATKRSYTAGLATIAVAFPEFQNRTADQIIATMRQMEHANPQRYAQALNALNKMADTEKALIANEQRQQHAQRQQFEHHARTEDAKFERMVPRTPQQKAAVGKELVAYAAELGISQNQLAHALQTNPVLRTAAFQKVISDAVEARLAKKAVAAYRNKAAPVPHVAKPGNGGGRIATTNADLASLNRTLNTAKTQNDALRAAAALLTARRKGR
jgi:hypothetical protein